MERNRLLGFDFLRIDYWTNDNGETNQLNKIIRDNNPSSYSIIFHTPS